MLLETPRLRLRPYGLADLAAIVAGLNDWTVAQWLARTPYPYRPADADAFLAEAAAAHAGGRFAIADRATDRLIGAIGVEHGTDDRELGYWLAREQWGRGLMSEAVTAIVDHAFGTLGVRRLHATTDPDNAASQRVLLKAGFRRIGSQPADPPTRRGHPARPLFERRAG
jgi:RimJ/RimL family protein N-acetyltransferase